MSVDDNSADGDPRSEIARRLERLRQMTISAAEKREHLPQPLFWSLFRSELEVLKREKDFQRLVGSVFK